MSDHPPKGPLMMEHFDRGTALHSILTCTDTRSPWMMENSWLDWPMNSAHSPQGTSSLVGSALMGAVPQYLKNIHTFPSQSSYSNTSGAGGPSFFLSRVGNLPFVPSIFDERARSLDRSKLALTPSGEDSQRSRGEVRGSKPSQARGGLKRRRRNITRRSVSAREMNSLFAKYVRTNVRMEGKKRRETIDETTWGNGQTGGPRLTYSLTHSLTQLSAAAGHQGHGRADDLAHLTHHKFVSAAPPSRNMHPMLPRAPGTGCRGAC
ncbi:hypothetical protein BDP55DRAFT_99316 [Colletotrichum godetiae]|uniref:Uncharacterized protein n=1 Tax=Colletotrichum godetiae TaxID=1209918 RepID=A0AAJ0EUZ5_9PEZI|nr:uncharacterized protein BDP55DRAFT_99316 [Colletotrichum godetiae]KAK1676732.1 hypothetical protein BDP55DRAFT_99316 [Colletotrichum godetiae]